jgi:hypothetical protein
MQKESQDEKEINDRFVNYFINKTEEYEKESAQNDYPFISPLPNCLTRAQSSPNEEEDNEMPNLELTLIPYEQSLLKNTITLKIFDVIYPGKYSVFTRIENDLSYLLKEEEMLCQRKRYNIRRKRRENNDNIRKKIKRGFFNKGLIHKLNMILKNQNINSYFEIFQQHFVGDVTKRTNNQLMNMTLEEIFEKKELYQESELKSYKHNFNLVKSIEIQENKELKNILNKKLYLIFEEYINSKEFLIDEINRLKNKKMDNGYIQRYIYLTKHFIEFAFDN